MANISYKASMTMTNRYGWNGGNEYEDEGELNYSNTFYRKYDAQIGRFTGIDIKAEATVSLNPYQFGNNNPVLFNDPLGDLSNLNGQEGRMRKGLDGNYHVGWYNDLMWGGMDGDFNTRGDGESYSGGGGGGGSHVVVGENTGYTFEKGTNILNQIFNIFNSLGDNQIGRVEQNSNGNWALGIFNTNFGKDAQGTIVLVGGNDISSKGGISDITTMLGNALSSFFKDNKMNINIRAFSSDLRGAPVISSIVNYVKENHNPSTPLFVYGYSLGGVAANQAIKILSLDKIRVNLFYAVDASTGPMRLLFNGLQISSNVDRFINVYQTRPSSVGSRGYPASPMEGNYITHGLNYNYDALRTYSDSRAHGQMAADLYQSVLTTFQNQMFLLTHP